MPSRPSDHPKFIDYRAASLLICTLAELSGCTATRIAAYLCSRLPANLPVLSADRGVRQRVPETLSPSIEFIEFMSEGGLILEQVVEAYALIRIQAHDRVHDDWLGCPEGIGIPEAADDESEAVAAGLEQVFVDIEKGVVAFCRCVLAEHGDDRHPLTAGLRIHLFGFQELQAARHIAGRAVVLGIYL